MKLLDPPEAQAQSHTGRYLGGIRSLLSVAAHETHADAFAFYEFQQEKGTLELRLSSSPLLTRSAQSSGALSVITFPLQGSNGLAGTLDFGFRDIGQVTEEQRDVLQKTADSVQAILRASEGAASLLELTERITQLEADLANQKIAERADGLLRAQSKQRKAEVLRHHVESVLSLRPIEESLTAHLRDLEERLTQRRLLADAKAVLQRTHGYTEEEAYILLRETSRRTRTRLREVAEQVLSGTGLFQQEGRLSA